MEMLRIQRVRTIDGARPLSWHDRPALARRQALIFSICAIVAIALAVPFDAMIARAMHALGIGPYLHSSQQLRDIVIAPGWYPFTLLVAAIVAFLHRDGLKASMFLLLTTASAASNEVFKWGVGRIRPFKLEGAGERLAPFEFQPLRLAYVKNLCFPSGHTTLAFATAAALGMLFPRLRPLWYAVASVVAIERVAETAHWLSDVVAGAALGIAGAYVVAWLLKTWKIDLLTSRS